MKRFAVALFLLLLFSLPVSAYDDVTGNEWYADAVGYVTDLGLMKGTGNDKFSPGGTFSRAMFAQVMYRLNGSPDVAGGGEFVDVRDDAWYATAVSWAHANGLMSGYGKGEFGPSDPVTREQLATVLYRNSSLGNVHDNRILGIFDDDESVSWWAVDGLSWAVTNGLVTGSGTTLCPRMSATRAEVAQIMYRYCRLSDEAEPDTSQSYIHVEDGVIHTNLACDEDKKVRFKIVKDGKEIICVMHPNDEYEFTFPYGPGEYELTLFENTHDTWYRRVEQDAYTLSEDEWMSSVTSSSDYYDMVPGLNLVVNRLWRNDGTIMENARAVFDWICRNVRYDYDRMKDVQVGYLPDIAHALYDGKGVCLDYACLFASMLRSKGVPCQAVVGYYDGDTCHAWARFECDGTWYDVDPTFGASLYSVRDRYFCFENAKYVEDWVL